MNIDQEKLAKMRAESQNAQNILEEALNGNSENDYSTFYKQEEEKKESEAATHPILMLSPVKDKIGYLHIEFLKEIHDLGRQNNVSNAFIEQVTQKYHVNLFLALTCLDDVAREKYNFSLLKESLFDISTKQITIEFDSDNVEKFLSMESSFSWKTALGSNCPENTEFHQQIASFLSENGINAVSKKEQYSSFLRCLHSRLSKISSSNALSQAASRNNKSPIEFISHPEIEEEFGISIECSAKQSENSVIVYLKAVAKNKITDYRAIHFIAYNKEGNIIDESLCNWIEFGRMQSSSLKLQSDERIVKIEYFPGA